MTSYFYLQAEKNSQNAQLIDLLEEYADSKKTLIYVLNKPLTDQKYSYTYKNALIILCPKHKITIINCGLDSIDFEDYIEDVIEDIGSISDKYLYKEILGRPRYWRRNLVEVSTTKNPAHSIAYFLQNVRITDEYDIKKIDLLISLFIGSINDVERVKEEVPQTLLDKVKQKIQLFDGDQTRFIYQQGEKKRVRIQGLSGTGKTELLLHKLKDLYINDPSSSIGFTCWNKILADNLRTRIPSFFNFMKVEQQIEWNKRLWCVNAWGSGAYSNSGIYRYICAFYQIPFHRYSYQMQFGNACNLAIDAIKAKFAKENQHEFAFTYLFIDESQDFEDSFFDLCDLVTEKRIYIAGDIFQSIFDENISSTIEPDFLLGKCYRTDPKTLMFAHGLGMGLFEENKLRWLERKEWIDCGYNVNVEGSKYFLSREPLRRFEDLSDDFESIKIVEEKDTNQFSDRIIQILKEIVEENSTVNPNDIGIILLDQNNYIYKFADILEMKIRQNFSWSVNKAYETKEKTDDRILISNRNNVKGLEFPFVICVTLNIRNSPSYRNAIYTMLTRSFIKSYLLVQPTEESGFTDGMKKGLKQIIEHQEMIIEEPSPEEKSKIQTRFKYNLKKVSHYDLMIEIFTKLQVEKQHREKLLQATQQLDMIDCSEETLTEFIRDNLKYLRD